MPHKKVKASIIGVTGYTGLELLRLLIAHPHVDIGYVTSRQYDNEPIGNVYPHLAHLDIKITNTDHNEAAKDSDVIFLCLPHKTAQDAVADLHGKVKVVDLSADYRLDDAETYERYYNVKHHYPHLLDEVVYGLPEIVGTEAIQNATTIANPGCFAALSQFLLFPFKGNIASADIFAITGSSGAGKSPKDGTHHPIRNHNIRSYNINLHRHMPEITRTAGINESQLNFVPTSGPFTRGIFATAFISLSSSRAQPRDLTHNNQIPPLPTVGRDDVTGAYENCPYVRLQKQVALADVVGSNFVDLSFATGHDGRIIAQGALDNLVKGAAGTAVQNMNLMFGLDQTTGLINLSPVYP